MGRLAFLLVTVCAVAMAADDPWAKVKEIKSGVEIRIVRKGVAKPIEAKFDEARDDSLLVVLKNEQVAIPREEIERLDARPTGKSRMNTETKTSTTSPDPTPPKGMNHGPNVPGTNYSSGVTIGGKPDYQMVYRKPPAAPKK